MNLHSRVVSVYGVLAIGYLAHKIADLSLECAALLAIFVPLELWDRRPDHGALLQEAARLTGYAFALGIAAQIVGIFAYRIKDDLEGKRGTKASSNRRNPSSRNSNGPSRRDTGVDRVQEQGGTVESGTSAKS